MPKGKNALYSAKQRLEIASSLLGITAFGAALSGVVFFVFLSGEPKQKPPVTSSVRHFHSLGMALSAILSVVFFVLVIVLCNWRDNLKEERRREIKTGGKKR